MESRILRPLTLLTQSFLELQSNNCDEAYRLLAPVKEYALTRLPDKILLIQFVKQVRDILLARDKECQCIIQNDFTSGTVFPCAIEC